MAALLGVGILGVGRVFCEQALKAINADKTIELFKVLNEEASIEDIS
jgi:hypothetical protein